MNREELRKIAEESHRIWFKRWIKKNRKYFENELVIAAKNGQKSVRFNYPVGKISSYLRCRLLDRNTYEYLKNEFNDIQVLIYEKSGIFGGVLEVVVEFKF